MEAIEEVQVRPRHQKQKVLIHLQEGKGITPLEALTKFGAFRLSAIIFNLKKDGYDIQTDMIKNGGKHYANYSIKSQ